MPDGSVALQDENQVGSAAPQFVQGLGLFSATAIVMGSMIGSGIFIVSAEMSRGLGSPALLIAAWLVTALMTIDFEHRQLYHHKSGPAHIYCTHSVAQRLAIPAC